MRHRRVAAETLVRAKDVIVFLDELTQQAVKMRLAQDNHVIE